MRQKQAPQQVSAALASRVLRYLTKKARNGVAAVRQIDIASATDLSEASVCLAVFHLEAKGFLVAERYRGGMRYRLNAVSR